MDKIDKITQRFQEATRAIGELGVWLYEGGAVPECVTLRAAELGMTTDEYMIMYKNFSFLDERSTVERAALEDIYIRKVQPEWKRKL